MKVTDVAIQRAPRVVDRLQRLLLYHDGWLFCDSRYQDHQRSERAVRGDAFAEDHGQLCGMPDQEPFARPLLATSAARSFRRWCPRASG